MLVVDLPTAPMRTVVTQAISLLGALDRADDPASDWQAQEADRHAVFDVLAWCWEAITEPVLAALGHTCTPGEKIEDWPRVWWSPTGPAAALPLHAAGRHPRTATQYQAMGEAAAVSDSVAGRVVSSYIPTLAALIRARARPAPSRVRQLAVGVPNAPHTPPALARCWLFQMNFKYWPDTCPRPSTPPTWSAPLPPGKLSRRRCQATRGCTYPATASSTRPMPRSAPSSCTIGR